MPKWLSRRPQPPEKPAPSVPPSGAKPSPVKGPPPSASPSGPARRAADLPPEPRPADLSLDVPGAVQAGLRQDLNERLTAHRQQGRVLERNQKLREQAEHELRRHPGPAQARD